MTVRTLGRIGSLLLVAAVVPACDPFPGYFNPFPENTLAADLRGSQVVPVNAAVSTGTATVTVSPAQTSFDYSVAYTGAGVVTSVTVNRGSAGTNGPVLFTLASAPFTNPLTGTVTGVGSQAAADLLSGNAYILISTVGSPAGEIRGQLGSVALAAAALTGAQEVPPVASAGSGSASLQLNSAQTQITATVTFSGLAATTMAHLHLGAVGVGGGPIIFNLSLVPFTSPLTVTLTSADFIAAGGLVTFADAVNALLSGNLYVNIHTAAVPGGELRGQVGPARLTAALTGGSVVPASGSAATGTGSISLNATQTAVNVALTHSVASPTSVLIHADDPGSNGPAIFDVDAIAGSAASPVNAALQAAHLIPAPAKAITTFPQAVNALLTSKTYLEVGTSVGPDIRGQIVP